MICRRLSNNNKLSIRTVISSLLICLLICQRGLADRDHTNADSRIDEITVTGSRLTRRDFSAPSPIVTIGSAEIAFAGATTLEEMLNALPQVIADRDRSTNSFGGTAAINLRGLGRERTLVMLNGRRFSPSEVRGGVDINNIPAALVEHVEVVTGGASAVYGSDAVVGIVNFIVDKEFEGIELAAQYDVTHESDGEEFDLNITAGTSFAGGRGHIAGFFNFNDRRAILGADRKFTSTTIVDDTRTGELSEFGSSAVPEGAILFPDTIIDGEPFSAVIFNQDGTLRPANFPDDLYNFNPDNYLQVPLERFVAAAFVNFDLSSNLDSELEILYANNTINAQLAPSPVSFFGLASIDSPFLPAETQQIIRDSFDPDGDGLAEFFLRRRMQEIEPRRFEDGREVIRILAGLSGAFTDSWGWKAHFSHTETDVDPLRFNAVSASRFGQALLIDPITGGCLDASNGCVPANVFGAGNVSQAAADFMRFDTLEHDETIEERMAGFAVSGELLEFAAGPIGFAGGVEWRRQEAELVPDAASLSDDIVGGGGFQPAIGASEVSEVFAEVLVPLLVDRPIAEYLAIEAGVRYSDYNTAGSVDTWKLGAEWLPIQSLRFRAMYQNAIRAPSIFEIFEVPFETVRSRFNAETDLCSASRDPVGNGLTDVCIAQGLDPGLIGVFEAPDPNFVTFFTGGNPALRPEESTSKTVGFVLQPQKVPRLSVSVDYFDIEIESAILDIQAGALAACFALKDPNSNLCAGYTRDASGRIAEANNFPRNVAVQRSQGVDLQMLYSIDAPTLALFDGPASFDLTMHGTWYITNGSQSDPLTPFFDCAGYFGPTCAFSNFGSLPEFKTTTRLTYTSGPLQASVRWRWIDGMKNSEPFFTALFNLPNPLLAIPEIGSRSYIDLSAIYEISGKVALNAGIKNLFNTDPPLLAGAAPGLNTDTSTFDTIGRRYFLAITYAL